MAWNGRNVSILGDKAPAAGDTPGAPSNKAGDTSKSNKAADVNNKTAPPAPTSSVWGKGRHQKILAIRDPTPVADASSVASSTKTPITSSPKLEELSVSSPKDVKVTLPSSSSTIEKSSDETTNSTAGSSTTNTTIEDMNPSAAVVSVEVGVKVVTTSVTEKKEESTPSSRPRSDSKSKINKSRPRSDSKGGQANNNQNFGNNGNQGNNKTFARGNGSGGSASRRRGKHLHYMWVFQPFA